MRGGILIGLLALVITTAGINKVVINRMAYDVESTLQTRELAKVNINSHNLLNKAKVDMYKSETGYTDEEGVNHLENKLNEEVTGFTVTGFSLFHSIDNLYLKSDKGALLTSPFNNFDWNYNSNNMGWDGEKFNNLNTDISEYRMYRLNLNEGYTEGLDYIYNLEFYEPLENQVNLPYVDLQGCVGILIKMENGSVSNYTILNSKIENYTHLQALDFKGNKLYEIHREVLSKVVNIPGTEMLKEYSGHYITINSDNPTHLAGTVVNSPYTRINSSLGEQIITGGTEEFEIALAKGIGEVTLEIYGTDIFSLELGYIRMSKY